MKWIKINNEEDLPKDLDKNYFIYTYLRGVPEDKYFYTASLSDSEWIIDNEPTFLGVLKEHEHYGYGDRIVTHWMLPEPPEEE